MRPTDHSVHPFLIPCQADRSFAALSLACSPHPYSHSPFSQPFLTARHQHLHPPVSRTASLPAVKTHMARTATARTVRCMPGSPHLHIAAFIAPFIAARQTLLPVPDELRRTQASSVVIRPSSNTENGRALAAISAFTRRARAKSDCTNTVFLRDIFK